MRLFITILAMASLFTGWTQPAGSPDYFAEGKKAKTEKNYSLAIENFKKATAQKPDDGEAWYEMGWCYNELAKYADAIKSLENAKTYWKNQAKVYYESGYAYDFAGLIDKAVSDYLECIQLFSSYSGAYRQLANIYFDVDKDYKNALKYYSQYIDYSLESEISSKTWYKKGFSEMEMDQYEDAIISLKKSVALDTKYAYAYNELGYAYYILKKYDEALMELDKSIKIAESSVPYYYCGLCYIAKNQKTKAQDAYKKLTDLNSPDAATLLTKINAMP
jgi:tetratricopeptide (TPR) repeat protein